MTSPTPPDPRLTRILGFEAADYLGNNLEKRCFYSIFNNTHIFLLVKVSLEIVGLKLR